MAPHTRCAIRPLHRGRGLTSTATWRGRGDAEAAPFTDTHGHPGPPWHSSGVGDKDERHWMFECGRCGTVMSRGSRCQSRTGGGGRFRST